MRPYKGFAYNITVLLKINPNCRSFSNQKFLSKLNFVNGERVFASSSTTYDLREPATGSLLGETQCSDNNDVALGMASCVEAFDTWSKYSGNERAKVLMRAADIIRKRKDEIAKWDSVDTGLHVNDACTCCSSQIQCHKTTQSVNYVIGRCIKELEADVDNAVESLEYFASLASTSVGHHIKLENGDFVFVTKEPYGVVAGIIIVLQTKSFPSV